MPGPSSDDPVSRPRRGTSVTHGAARVALGVVQLAAWGAVAAMAALVVASRTSYHHPYVLLAVGLLPALLLPAWPIALVAALPRRSAGRHARRRRRPRSPALAAAAAAVCVAHLVLMAPAVVGNPRPAWAAHSPRLRVVAANLRFDNDHPAEMARDVARLPADVLVLSEVNPRLWDALDAAGVVDRYRYRVMPDIYAGKQTLILSRYRIRRKRLVNTFGALTPVGTIVVGGTPVTVVGAHPDGPATRYLADRWAGQIGAMRDLAAQTRGQKIVAGDFNSGRWHQGFRDLLHIGLADAADEAGQGWRPTWGPVRGVRAHLPRILRLDHVLTTAGITQLSVSDHDVAGSDHRAIAVTLAVRPT